MKPQNVIFSLCLVLTVLVLLFSRIRHEPPVKEAFDRKGPGLVYTRSALSHMKCQGIQVNEVEEIRQKGIINFNRSDRTSWPDALLVLQGETSGGKKLRVYFSQGKKGTRVLDCLILQKDGSAGDPCSFSRDKLK